MVTFAELQDRVSTLVQDDDRSDTNDISFGDLINQGVAEIAGGMQSVLGDWITPPLPKLLTINTVDTSISAAYVDMPTNYQRNLRLAVRASGQEIDISNSFIAFVEIYPLLDKSGIISEVVEHGNVIYYQGIPTVSEEITLYYYRLPVAMTADEDVPDGIPLHLQNSLLINFAAWKAYEFIEDGLEGDMPNTQKFMELFLTALKTLELSIPYDTRGLMLR